MTYSGEREPIRSEKPKWLREKKRPTRVVKTEVPGRRGRGKRR